MNLEHVDGRAVEWLEDKCAQLQLELRQKMHEMGSMQGRMQAIHQMHSPHGPGTALSPPAPHGPDTALSPPRSTWPWYCTPPLHDHFTLPLCIIARVTMEVTQIARQIVREPSQTVSLPDTYLSRENRMNDVFIDEFDLLCVNDSP